MTIESLHTQSLGIEYGVWCAAYGIWRWSMGNGNDVQPTVLLSQRQRVLSAEAEIRELENGRKCTALTESMWPLNVDTHTPLRGREPV